MRYALILGSMAGLLAATDYDPAEVLARATRKVLASSARIPNYTCVETVTRNYFAPLAATLPRSCPVLLEQRRHRTPDMLLMPYSKDRLRLDVTLSERGEIFSWAGADRFDGDVDLVISHGPMSSGGFAGFLAVVFEGSANHTTFARRIDGPKGTLLEYSFQVDQPHSRYKVKYDSRSWVFVPYSGSFQVEPETAEVVHMEVATGEMPPATGVCTTATTLDFANVQIGSGRFLLPWQATQRFVYPNVQEVENAIAFANCREFRGESTVTFAPEVPAPLAMTARGHPARNVQDGARFSLALTKPIPTDTAAAGDFFSGRLLDALRDAAGKVLAPKGSTVEGRLLRVQTFTRPPEAIVVLRPETVRAGGSQIELHAVRDWSEALRQKKRKGVEILLPLKGEEHSAVFHFSGEHVTIPSGFRSDWKTVPPHDSGDRRTGAGQPAAAGGHEKLR